MSGGAAIAPAEPIVATAAMPTGGVSGKRHGQDGAEWRTQKREAELDRVEAGLVLDGRDPLRPRAEHHSADYERHHDGGPGSAQ